LFVHIEKRLLLASAVYIKTKGSKRGLAGITPENCARENLKDDVRKVKGTPVWSSGADI
jgi:hypothetical protein